MPDPLMLSVSGLRGLVGRSLTPEVASRYAAAFGQWLKGQCAGRPARVVVGRDSRQSGEMIELAVMAGLIGVGCRVVRLGIVPTPAVAIMVDEVGGDGGVVVTASHNPIAWNGIKLLRSDGVAPLPDEVNQIIDRFHRDDVERVAVDDLVPTAEDGSATQVHVRRILDLLDAAAVRRRGLKVVLDSNHGAGGPSSATLLAELGVQLEHLYAEPSGRFVHPPEPLRENLTEICEQVRVRGADVGFAQDPDADRLAIVDDQGRYIGEEYTFALCCLHVLSKRHVGEKIAVTNLSTSRMADDIAAAAGARVVRTAVGEANVVAQMRDCGAIIGGEGNGGVMLPSVCLVRDSLTAIGLVLELLATGRQALSSVVDQMPSYAITKQKLPMHPQALERVSGMLQAQYADQQVDLQDGVRIDWPDRWVHVRPSNTEPIVRVIAEAATEPLADELANEVLDRLRQDRA